MKIGFIFEINQNKNTASYIYSCVAIGCKFVIQNSNQMLLAKFPYKEKFVSDMSKFIKTDSGSRLFLEKIYKYSTSIDLHIESFW